MGAGIPDLLICDEFGVFQRYEDRHQSKALEELIKQSYAPVTINVTPEDENPSNRNKARKRLLQADKGSGTEVKAEVTTDAD